MVTLVKLFPSWHVKVWHSEPELASLHSKNEFAVFGHTANGSAKSQRKKERKKKPEKVRAKVQGQLCRINSHLRDIAVTALLGLFVTSRAWE